MDKFIGARVKSARLSLGWSQSDLAQELGITFQQVQKYENGTNRVRGDVVLGFQVFQSPAPVLFRPTSAI
ncbi:helix-turn-helix transcriptional regulator (plasmid) [Rhizobium sp. BG4]|nr:helix-turn-helix transcriptional regulator [Rhizobium sp. BG4]